MKVLLDTSVLVAAMVEVHPGHAQALPWLQRAKRKEVTAVVACHSLAELYAVLTALPVQPRILPSTAWRLIQENILGTLDVIPLSSDDYQSVLEHLFQTGIVGGAIYDTLIAYTASKAKVDYLVTFNEQDFRRVWPALSEKIIAP